LREHGIAKIDRRAQHAGRGDFTHNCMRDGVDSGLRAGYAEA
jgi:hypothetical protein